MSRLSEIYLSPPVIAELRRRRDIASEDDLGVLVRNSNSALSRIRSPIRVWDLNATSANRMSQWTAADLNRLPLTLRHLLLINERPIARHVIMEIPAEALSVWSARDLPPEAIVFRTIAEKAAFVIRMADRVCELVRPPASEVPMTGSYQGPTATEIAAAIWATPIAETNLSSAAQPSLFDLLSSPDPAHAEAATDAINDFTRTRMREDGHYGRIMPPLNITNDELDREIAAMPAAVSAHTGIEAPFTLAERVAFLGELRKILRDSGAMEIRTGPGLEIEAVGADRFRITVPELPPAPPEGALTLSSFSPLHPDYLFHLAGPDGTLLLGVTTDGEVVGEARGLEQLLTSLEMSRRKRAEQPRTPLRRFFRPEDPARPSGRSDIP